MLGAAGVRVSAHDRKQRQEEQVEYDDLQGIDLSSLDLSSLELELETHKERRPFPLALALLLIAALVGVLLWVPRSSYYQRQGATNSWIFFGICIGAIAVGLLGGRWLWIWAQDAARRYAERHPHREKRDAPPEPASALTRWLTLLSALGGAGFLLFGIPPGALSGGGRGYSLNWFLTVGGAFVVGILMWRWLLMQDALPKKERLPPKPIQLPSWFKWVSLAFLVLTGVFVVFGADIIPTNDPESLRFGLGGIAFVLGILGAIWIVRRFDETEKRIKESRNARRR